MPNHTSVKLHFNQDAKTLLGDYLSANEEGDFLDFQKVIPMPDDLEITEGSVDLTTKEGRDRKKQYEANTKKYGYPSWYLWRIHNWGTKWNSYWNDFDGQTLSLHTAWSAPTPVIKKLSKVLKAKIRMTYVDEGMGFWGETFFENGEVRDFSYNNLKKTPPDLAEELGLREMEAV